MDAMSEVVINQVLAQAGSLSVFRACKQGLQINDLMLLKILREYVLDPDDPNVMVSVRELAKITTDAGLLSKSQVETSLKRLVDAGVIIREQRNKRDREIAITTLLPLAFHLLEDSSKTQVSALPPVLRGLLAGEPGELIAAVQRAWDNSEMPEHSIASLYRGGGEGWQRIEALLAGRIEETASVIEAAIEEQESRDACRRRGVYQVDVAGGQKVRIDARMIERNAPAPCDVEIAVEVLAIAEQSRPGTITSENVHTRLAEALYSRHIGFARNLDAARAITVIGRQMAKSCWSRPFSIRDAWYSVCEQAVSGSFQATCSQVS